MRLFWATSGIRSDQTRSADAQRDEDLVRLSRAASRTTDEDLQVLVHDIRMRSSLGNAQNGTDMAAAFDNLSGSWTSLKVLLATCSEKGFPVTQYARTFAAQAGKDLGPTYDRASPIYRACTARGFAMDMPAPPSS